MSFHIGFSVLTKHGGALTKRISLSPDGRLISDGSACLMSRGVARREQADLSTFAGMIGTLDPNQAIALGSLRPDLPANVQIATKAYLDKLNGEAPASIIARTGDSFQYTAGEPALALLDVDTKAMPPAVRTRIDALGGYWNAIVATIPELGAVGHVIRRSTSTAISRTDTGEKLTGSDGLHVYVLVADGSDIERFLRCLHDRCWLAGLGWMMVGAAGQLLRRCIVDRMVGAPERLVFEGPPVVDPPLTQDQAARQPVASEGQPLDTMTACCDLSNVERARLRVLETAEERQLNTTAKAARLKFIDRQATKIVDRTGCSADAARQTVERQCDGILLPAVVLPFDDAELAGTTVADVLADPGRFERATLADPLEGVEYGRCKATVMRHTNGTPWIKSFAHGRAVYELKYDAPAIEAALLAADAKDAAGLFVKLLLQGDINPIEEARLKAVAVERSGVKSRPLNALIKSRRAEERSQRSRENGERRQAARTGRRVRLDVPLPDAEWLPVMKALNDVLGSVADPEPPMRDIDGFMTHVRVRRVPNMHALTSDGANSDKDKTEQVTATEQPLLTRLKQAALAELIEQHIEHVDKDRSVQLPRPFVEHFLTRTDDVLPIVAAIATLPIVLRDGLILSKRGLDRERGIVFRVPPDLLALIPKPEECTSSAVAEAMQFLTDTWLCDVSTDYVGKCILISAALTLIERSVLAERPAFFVTAGRRGGGKTTALVMLLVVVMGTRPSAAAWSSNEEERRKALLAYLMEGLAAIVWDNIPRGTQISCPHIEKSCTTAFYSDRRLGVSEMVAVSASVVHLFTGNNIGPRGDLASRSLNCRLEVSRADPENRDFKHADPVGWTEANRAKILRSLYIVLLGNPTLRPGSEGALQTRFKEWWRLVGSAVENAAKQHVEHVAALTMDATDGCAPTTVSFKNLFLSQEVDDEENASLADALSALAAKWPRQAGFKSSDVAKILNDRSEYAIDTDKELAVTIWEFLFAKVPPNQDVSSKSVGKALKRHVGEPVTEGKRTLILKESRDLKDGPHGTLSYLVQGG